VIKTRRNIRLLTVFALACALAPALFAGQLTYRQAAAPWTAQQAVELAPLITPAFLKEVALERGPAAAGALALKGARVRGLLKRYGDCSLKNRDLAAAEKYLDPEFRAELGYFAAGGCDEFRSSAENPRSVWEPPSAVALERVAAGGDLGTRAGSSRFFDNSAAVAGADPVPVPAAEVIRSEGRARSIPAPLVKGNSRFAGRVPELKAHVSEPELKQGPFNRATDYLRKMRRENWSSFRDGNVSGKKKAAALGLVAVGAACGFLLWYTNLAAVETAAARLRRDRAAGAEPRVLKADAAKLAFHVGLTMIAPIPIANISAAMAAGRLWGFLVVGYVGVAIANRFYHFAD
jgi:hypothetical protein